MTVSFARHQLSRTQLSEGSRGSSRADGTARHGKARHGTAQPAVVVDRPTRGWGYRCGFLGTKRDGLVLLRMNEWL